MASKHTVSVTRPTARGDWLVVLPAVAFGPKGRNDAEGPFVFLVGEEGGPVERMTAQVRFGARAGAIIASLAAGHQAAAVVGSVREMRVQVAAGYQTDARKGAVAAPPTVIAVKAVTDLAGGARVRAALGRVPASRRVEAAPQILADAQKG